MRQYFSRCPRFQSTLPVRGATRELYQVDEFECISIHAPREGSDQTDVRCDKITVRFQSTLPVRGATLMAWSSTRSLIFQSTLPVRGATGRSWSHGQPVVPFQSTLPVRGATCVDNFVPNCLLLFQSTLPVRGATWSCGQRPPFRRISIHAPREGSDMDRIDGW